MLLEIWMGTFVAELILYGGLWKFRRPVTIILSLYILLSTLLLWHNLGLFVGLPLGLLLIYRLGNLGRILKARMHPAYLLSATKRTSYWLLILHGICMALVVIPLFLPPKVVLHAIQYLQMLVAVGLLLETVKNIQKLTFKPLDTFLSDRELPTVTVAIPARNETTDLEECLHAVLANDYPKLEVIVLDDCSQGKTADIIKSFAHDGVRFVQGKPPADRWLAKNQAYQKLYEEATGDYILFIGVDVRLGRHAIRSMVNLAKARSKTMLSVLPVRINSTPAAAFIQPMRYWWELSLPRKLFNRPPVLSTCWLIDRKVLKKMGGFGSVCHAIMPEGYFAREAIKNNRYSFVRSSGDLEVRTAKSLIEQRETAIRMRYPQVRRRPEWALIMSVANALFLSLPFLFLLGGFWTSMFSLTLAGLTCIALIVTHVLIVTTTDPSNSFFAVFNMPFVALAEQVMGYLSMVRYEFFTVEWKDRNICIPVMHVIPKLPDLPERSDKA